MKANGEPNWKYKFKVKDLQFKLYKLKDKLEMIGYTFEEHDRLVSQHKRYSKQLKELKQEGTKR